LAADVTELISLVGSKARSDVRIRTHEVCECGHFMPPREAVWHWRAGKVGNLADLIVVRPIGIPRAFLTPHLRTLRYHVA